MKTCEYGHHWYAGITCPLCDYLGRDNIESAMNQNSEADK